MLPLSEKDMNLFWHCWTIKLVYIWVLPTITSISERWNENSSNKSDHGRSQVISSLKNFSECIWDTECKLLKSAVISIKRVAAVDWRRRMSASRMTAWVIRHHSDISSRDISGVLKRVVFWNKTGTGSSHSPKWLSGRSTDPITKHSRDLNFLVFFQWLEIIQSCVSIDQIEVNQVWIWNSIVLAELIHSVFPAGTITSFACCWLVAYTDWLSINHIFFFPWVITDKQMSICVIINSIDDSCDTSGLFCSLDNTLCINFLTCSKCKLLYNEVTCCLECLSNVIPALITLCQYYRTVSLVKLCPFTKVDIKVCNLIPATGSYRFRRGCHRLIN